MPAFVMPRLSDTMTEGTIVEWTAADGAIVTKGEEIVEIEGDKATMAVAADADGALKILVPAGETLSVLEPIAWIGEDPPADEGADLGAPPDPAPTVALEAQVATSPAQRQRVSPVARRYAEEHGIDLATVTGTGPGGRVMIADVTAPTTAPTTAKGGSQQVPTTPTQSLIARRMAEAKATIPDFQAWVEIDMEEGLALRGRLREAGEPTPSLTDLVVAATARVLREFPRLNGSYRDGAFELHDAVNVGVAVASEDALLVPTVFAADRKSAVEIGAETRRLAELARDGRLTAPQMAGATFTVSNLGMFGVAGFRAIVTPPQAGILAIGAVLPRVVPYAGGIAVRSRLVANLSVDHRIVYGAEAARFLGRLRELLESGVGKL